MKFGEFLRRDTGKKGVVAPPSTLAKLERELKAGHLLSVLLERDRSIVDGLPFEHLREIVESYRRYQRWHPAAVALGRRLESIEREVISRTTSPAQIAALDRAFKLAIGAGLGASERPGVLVVALELWGACMTEVRRRAQVRCAAARSDHPLLDQYGDYVARSESLDALRAHRWLAMRRGERDGALTLELDLGGVPLEEQITLRRGRLGKAALGRSDESLLQELVLDDLRGALWQELDDWARAESLKVACDAYAGLLCTGKLKVDRLGALYLGSPRDEVGAVVVDGEGVLLDSLERDPSQRGWMDEVVHLLKGARVSHLAVPSDTRSSKRLTEITERLGQSVSQIPIRPAALAEGRRALPDNDRERSRPLANALVLARRALDPQAAWGAIDPVRVGVGEYQSDLSEEELREALAITRAIVRNPGPKKSAAPLKASATKKPSPLGAAVRSISDLRPGMSISGQITNITGFGAFVSLGLEYEGMIHVSELSDEFISNPNEVVKIGDKVTARVLAVDPRRRRISLSLKTQTERDRRAPPRRAGPHRHQALRDLEKLFSKG